MRLHLLPALGHAWQRSTAIVDNQSVTTLCCLQPGLATHHVHGLLGSFYANCVR